MKPFFCLLINTFLTLTNISAQAIFDFTSLEPGAQDPTFHLPDGYTFQYLLEHGEVLMDGNTVLANNDFTGYVPINGSSTQGYLCINAETSPGGVSILDIEYDAPTKLWEITNSAAVDFAGVGGTSRNCSGAVTPWGTMITCEETTNFDLDADGYRDRGWAIEIDPATKKVVDHPGGLVGGDKLWAMGNFIHENAVVHENKRTVYQGVDSANGYLFKFVADQEEDLSSGKLYVYKGSKSGSGIWLLLQNSTPAEQNTTINQCSSLGATVFGAIEDVEINPLNGLVYLAVANESTVYRFYDDDPINGTTVTAFQPFVGGSTASYTIDYANGSSIEPWGPGNDNLAFDFAGNLWVFQDGGQNYIWLVSSCHTQTNPCVKIFGRTPFGSEPTGITFSPDGKFLFMSIQHPSFSNTVQVQTDAQGYERYFHRSVSIVVARDQFLGTNDPCPVLVDLGDTSLPSGEYQSCATLTSSNQMHASSVVLTASDTLCLEAGFEVKLGAEIDVIIE